jgi:hypothetical protein
MVVMGTEFLGVVNYIVRANNVSLGMFFFFKCQQNKSMDINRATPK